MMKITQHYNGDGRSEIKLRGVKVDEYGTLRVSKGQWDRLRDHQRGTGLDGTVGPVTYSLDGETVRVVCLE